MDGSSDSAAQAWFWRVWTFVGVAVAVVGAWWLLHDLLIVLVPPLVLAAVIVYLLNPLVGRLARHGVPRLVGVAAAYLVAIGALVGLGTLLGPILVRQAGDLLDELPGIFESLQKAANDQLARFGLEGTLLEFDLGSAATQEAIRDWLVANRDQVLELVRGAGSVLRGVLQALLTVILAPILAFYVLVDMPRISESSRRLVPPGPRSEIMDVAARIGATVGAYFRGQLLVAVFVGVATSLGLALVGLPFWAVVGLLAGLFNLVPFVGPFVGGLIGVTIAMTVGDGLGQAVAVMVVMVVVQQVDNHVITPNVVARTVKMHPITVILGLLVAGSLFGILGMLVAIPAIAAAKLLIVYVLVTRVPSMRHLAGDGAWLEDDGLVGDPPEGTLVALGRELRRTWERRRAVRDGGADEGAAGPRDGGSGGRAGRV